MKLIVIYQSSTGFTKQYAEWIARECICKSVDIKEISSIDLAGYDCIIYGGWIMGNMIMGAGKIKKAVPANKLVTFAVGASQDSEDIRNGIKIENHLENTPFFYMEGGFRYDKLNFFKKMMLNMVKKSVAKKENKTQQELYMEKILGTSFDHSNKKYIAPLVSYIKTLG